MSIKKLLSFFLILLARIDEKIIYEMKNIVFIKYILSNYNEFIV